MFQQSEISELRDICHRTAIDMGFYEGVNPYDHGHIWKQMSHLFIEATESWGRWMTYPFEGEEKREYLFEIADVGIVLLDLCGFIRIMPRSFDRDLGEEDLTHFNLFYAISRFADTFRKQGIATRELTNLSGTILLILDGLAKKVGENLGDAIVHKSNRNRERGNRYGVTNPE